MEVENQILLELINVHSIALLKGFMKIINTHYLFFSCARVEKKIFEMLLLQFTAYLTSPSRPPGIGVKVTHFTI